MDRRYRGRRGRGRRFFHNGKNNDFTSNNQRPKKNVNWTHRNNVQVHHASEAMNRLKEKDVGITEYISEYKGFNGIIKQRYADFHVNEIDCDGNIVSLTSITPPDLKVKHGDNKQELEEHLKSVVSQEIFEKIKELVTQKDDSNNNVEIEVTEMNKDDRRKLHNAIKAVGDGHLVSNTKEKEEKKFMVICKHNGKDKSERQVKWPTEYGGDYVHFVLYKENLDTMETVNFIASKLRIKPNMITYAGTKDRRGMTSQMMSTWHVEPKRLAALNSELRGASLGNYSLKAKGLKLGDLKGNRFRIVLRNVTGNDEQIEKAMTSLSEQGFVNYYGLQRFGSSVSVPTHAIGKALLQGDWKLAIELILKPREGEQNYELAEARKIWWESRDALRALRVLPNREKLIEGKLLLGLRQCAPNDYVNALEKIPRNTCLLYLHSYQSLVWNKVVSRRVKELGVKPVAGDLVFLNDAQTDVEDEESITPEASDNSSKKCPVKIVTEDELSTVHIHDIVMPLPGHEVMYPQNIMKEWYEEILKSDGLSSASLKQTVRKYSVGGAYRKLVIRPNNLKWKTMHYSVPSKALELSDKEKMNSVELPKDEPDGAYKALILDFCLPSSTYATMALREILKSDTSSQHQASLNDYHIKKDEVLSNSSEDSVHKPSTSTESTKTTGNEQSNIPNENRDQTEMLVDDNVDKETEMTISIPEKTEEMGEKQTDENNTQKEGRDEKDENVRKREIDDADVDGKKMKLEKEEMGEKQTDENNTQKEGRDEKDKNVRKREIDDADVDVDGKKMKLEKN